MDSFTGKCSGGPFDKQQLVHWTKTKKLYRPMLGFSMNMETAPVEAVEIGEYGWHQIEGYPARWNWHSTESGRAFDVLHGTNDNG